MILECLQDVFSFHQTISFVCVAFLCFRLEAFLLALQSQEEQPRTSLRFSDLQNEIITLSLALNLKSQKDLRTFQHCYVSGQTSTALWGQYRNCTLSPSLFYDV